MCKQWIPGPLFFGGGGGEDFWDSKQICVKQMACKPHRSGGALESPTPRISLYVIIALILVLIYFDFEHIVKCYIIA